jgi:hypothetical protein
MPPISGTLRSTAEHGFCWRSGVRRWQRSGRFLRVRRHAVSKTFALWIITLILLPFTAPFPTYELANFSSHHAFDWLPKEAKNKTGADDKLIVPTDQSLVPPVLNLVVPRDVISANQFEETPLQHIILRL